MAEEKKTKVTVQQLIQDREMLERFLARPDALKNLVKLPTLMKHLLGEKGYSQVLNASRRLAERKNKPLPEAMETVLGVSADLSRKVAEVKERRAAKKKKKPPHKPR